MPGGVREFAVTIVDPDAPMARPFVHWTVFHIPSSARSIARGAVPPGAVAGTTDWGETGYGGPCPPPGKVHRYLIRIDALNAVVPAAAATTEAAYERLRTDHVIQSATLVVLYGRT